MSTTYSSPETFNNTVYVQVGQLVLVKRNCFEQKGEFGIIIKCTNPDFSVGYDDDWWVYIGGELTLVKNFQIYPVNLH